MVASPQIMLMPLSPSIHPPGGACIPESGQPHSPRNPACPESRDCPVIHSRDVGAPAATAGCCREFGAPYSAHIQSPGAAERFPHHTLPVHIKRRREHTAERGDATAEAFPNASGIKTNSASRESEIPCRRH